MNIVTEGISKTGKSYCIRYIERTDAESAWEYINELSQEKTFVSLQGEEITLEKEREQIDEWVKGVEDGSKVALVLIVDGKVRGMCDAKREKRTESHIAWMGLAISANVRGEGIGGIFFQATIDESIKRFAGLRILALEVKAPNEVARSLYKKCGFIEFGTLPSGSMYRGEYVDQVFMYKPISS